MLLIGTGGMEIFTRLSRWVDQDTLVGLNISSAEIGSPDSKFSGSPKEKRNTLGLDLSYRISDHSSIFFEYDFTRVLNRNFVTHESEFDNLFRIEFTRSFGW